MKVLMFGWEFPPHISGGLGTACQGLTESLGRIDVETIFVVPRLFGGEVADHVSFISAEQVPLKKSTARKKETISSISHSQIEQTGYQMDTRISTQTIRVGVFLDPYQPTSEYEQLTEHEKLTEIAAWNYQLKFYRSAVTTSVEQSPDFITHSFSGTYGPDLMNEVDRYADVATEIARSYDFDIIHVHDWMTMRAGIAAKRVNGKPLIVHVHSTEYDRSGENINQKIFSLEKQGLDEADHILAVSRWTKDILVSRYGIPEEKIDVLHNGINPRKKALDVQRAGLGSHIVTFVGRITYQKGPLYFIRAAQKVLEKFPDAHFIFVGSGDMFPLAIEKVASLNLSSRFHFTGFIKGDTIDRIWSVSSVYVMPSVSEPFGITPLEAIQAGVPVIVSNQSGVSEVMPHAMKVDFWKTDELANAICNILAYHSLSSTLQKNALEEIKKITWDKAAQKIKTLYYELRSKH